jgi:hypothetical protein
MAQTYAEIDRATKQLDDAISPRKRSSAKPCRIAASKNSLDAKYETIEPLLTIPTWKTVIETGLHQKRKTASPPSISRKPHFG